jgi:cytochrome c biogenesis protein
MAETASQTKNLSHASFPQVEATLGLDSPLRNQKAEEEVNDSGAARSSSAVKQPPADKREDPRREQPLTNAWDRFLLTMGSVRTAVTLIVLTALFVLIGAWCPQESTVGQEKIIEQFGEATATALINLGVTDLFHTPLFLLDIALLSISLTIASFKRVFPRVKSHLLPMTPLAVAEIRKLPSTHVVVIGSIERSGIGADIGSADILASLATKLRRSGYSVKTFDHRLVAEFGKFARLSASVTHIGLLSLLVGVTITSWTGFTGFQPVRLGDSLSFKTSQHSKLWIGHLPKWSVRVDATRREDYESGEAKQWYSTLTVVDADGKPLKSQEISVNNELSYDGVDIYQSSWGMDQILVAFNEHEQRLDLRPMGQRYAAFLPLDKETILIFSLKEQDKPLRLFAKRPEWQAPRLLAAIAVGESKNLGSVKVRYIKPLPVTGLQYKRDPGLPITYVAFGFIMAGVCLAAIPHRKVWAAVTSEFNTDVTGATVTAAVTRTDQTGTDGTTYSPDGTVVCSCLYVGGVANKAKVGFAQNLSKILESLRAEFEAKELPSVSAARFNLCNMRKTNV